MKWGPPVEWPMSTMRSFPARRKYATASPISAASCTTLPLPQPEYELVNWSCAVVHPTAASASASGGTNPTDPIPSVRPATKRRIEVEDVDEGDSKAVRGDGDKR